MKKRIVKQGTRPKAFVGALIGLGVGIASSIISGKKKAKAEELDFQQKQAEQYRIDGLQQSAAMTSSYANQNYVDQYKDKVTLKGGGKVKYKKNSNTDRITNNKKFALGGKTKSNKDNRDKANFGSSLLGIVGGATGITSVGGAVAGLVGSIASNSKAPKMVKKADGFTYETPKNGLTPNSYQLDAEGNPITNVINQTPTVDPTTNSNIVPSNNVYNDRISQARMGKYKRVSKSK